MNLRIGHLSTFYHTATLLMADPETPARLGVDINWHLHGTGPALIEDFRHNAIDLAYIGLPPAIIGIASGLPLKCVAGGHMEGTVLSGRTGLRAYPEIQHLEELFRQFAGGRIGVPGKGSIHDVILTDCIQRFGLEDEIEVMNYRWSDGITEAFAQGELTAAMGTPALAVSLSRFADGKLLCPPHWLWPDNPSYGILAHERVIEHHPELVERFVQLHEDATQRMIQHPRESAETISNLVGVVDAEFVLDTLRISPRYCAQLSESFVRSTLDFSAVLVDLGYASRELSAEDIFDHQFINRVHPPGDHYAEALHL